MLKNPIQEVTNELQYRAIGIVNGIYTPHETSHLYRGSIKDNEGYTLETVILGKALSLIKKHIDLTKSYFWIVYPRNRSTDDLYLQVIGIWDPYQLNKLDRKNSEKDPFDLLKDLNLDNNYFSIRGQLIYVNSHKKEIIIKICCSPALKKNKNSTFKIFIKGEIPLDFLNNFVSLDVFKEGNALQMIKYEVIKKKSPKKSE